MSCDHVQPLLLEYARHQLDWGEAQLVTEHLTECAACRAALKESLWLSRMIHLAMPQRRSPVAWGRVAACLLLVAYWWGAPLTGLNQTAQEPIRPLMDQEQMAEEGLDWGRPWGRGG